MTSSKALKSIALFYAEGSSDKVYHASIEAKASGYVVNFAYGRRGSTLQTGSKTQEPVALDKAEKIYAKIVAEKMGKGYTPREGAVAFTGTDNAGRVSGITPQLLNEVSDADAQALILNDDYVAQEKMNGERRMTKDGEGVNRKGLLVPLPAAIAAEVKRVLPDGEFDGEQIGDVLHVFDLLRVNGNDLRSKSTDERSVALANLFDAANVQPSAVIRYVPVARSTSEKRALFDRIKENEGEGIVFKLRHAPYTPGRPNSGGTQLKNKFYETASVIVVGHNEQRSVRAAVLDQAGTEVDVGNITIPSRDPIPAIGAVVEVKYLYAYKGGALYQSSYIGPRHDIDRAECVQSQLKFKAA